MILQLANGHLQGTMNVRKIYRVYAGHVISLFRGELAELYIIHFPRGQTHYTRIYQIYFLLFIFLFLKIW